MNAGRRAAAGLLLVMGACLSPADPGSARVAAIQVTTVRGAAGGDTIRVREVTRVVATAVAAEGYDLGVSDFTWTSSDTAVATVDAAGTLRGIAPGTATITAARGGVRGDFRVTVLPATVAYEIAVGSTPGAIAFSTDFTHAYVAAGGDSLAIVQALDFVRARAIGVGLAIDGVAATSSAIYLTHAAADSVTVLSAATGERIARLAVTGAPTAIVASATRAYVGARTAHRIAAFDGDRLTSGPVLAGEPVALALSRDGTRLLALVRGTAGTSLVSLSTDALAPLASIVVPDSAVALAIAPAGGRAYVLVGGAAPRVLGFDIGAGGAFAPRGTIAVGTGATALAVQPGADGAVIVSGEPAYILTPALDRATPIVGAGRGSVAVRPDGLFAFIASPATGTIRVIGL